MLAYFVAVFLIVVLGWHNPEDLSINVVGSDIKHPLGLIGSYISDWLTQIWGYSKWLYVCFASFWGHGKHTIGRWLWSVLALFSLCLFFGEAGGGAVGYVLSLKTANLLSALVLPVWPIKPISFIFSIWFLCRSVDVHLGRVLYQAWLDRSFAKMKNPFLTGGPVLNKKEEPKTSKNEELWASPLQEEDNSEGFEEESNPEPSHAEKKSNNIVMPHRVSHVEDFICPSADLLDTPQKGQHKNVSEVKLQEQADLLASVLKEFGIGGEIVNVRPGPVVTLFELRPAPGIKTSRVIALADDIARSMSALSTRIAVIPGQNVIGIELPNPKRQTVYLKDIILTPEYSKTQMALPLILGQDIGGQTIVADLARMPHLLVAGTTGSGKSVSVNAMILSLLYRFSPDACKFIMIDPKMLELSVYDGIPHLLTPVVTDPKKAVSALKWAVKEMESRYLAMSRLGVRNIDGYNERLKEGNFENLTRRVQTGFDPETGRPIYENQLLSLEPLPYIVVVVDEMADLMLVAGKEIEGAVQRLAQMARAAGIHLIMATQRPSVDVITGTIKANFPTRISFQVTSKIDSRTILGEQGAEQLLGQGDMLFMAGGNRITRVHGPFVKDQEVDKVVQFLKAQLEPSYIESITAEDEPGMDGDDSSNADFDPLYKEAVSFIQQQGRISTSLIQRKFQIGYNRAARIVEQMEESNIVTPPNHTGKREIVA